MISDTKKHFSSINVLFLLFSSFKASSSGVPQHTSCKICPTLIHFPFLWLFGVAKQSLERISPKRFLSVCWFSHHRTLEICMQINSSRERLPVSTYVSYLHLYTCMYEEPRRTNMSRIIVVIIPPLSISPPPTTPIKVRSTHKERMNEQPNEKTVFHCFCCWKRRALNLLRKFQMFMRTSRVNAAASTSTEGQVR